MFPMICSKVAPSLPRKLHVCRLMASRSCIDSGFNTANETIEIVLAGGKFRTGRRQGPEFEFVDYEKLDAGQPQRPVIVRLISLTCPPRSCNPLAGAS